MTNPVFDMLIRGEDGQLIAAAEVKAYQGLTSAVAIDLRKTLIEHNALPRNIYFLLVSQDNGYLWKEDNAPNGDQPPIAAFSLSEPFSTLAKREADRRRLSKSLNDVLRDLLRSMSNQSLVGGMKPTVDNLVNIAKTELDTLQATLGRFLQAGRTISTTATIFSQAQTYQTTYTLSPQDSIIYAAIINDLDLHKGDSEKKCFISRNWKDFRVPGNLGQLTGLSCLYWGSL